MERLGIEFSITSIENFKVLITEIFWLNVRYCSVVTNFLPRSNFGFFIYLNMISLVCEDSEKKSLFDVCAERNFPSLDSRFSFI